MLMLDLLAQLATEAKIKLDGEEERKKAPPDQLDHQESVPVPEPQSKGISSNPIEDDIVYVPRRKRSVRDLVSVIRNDSAPDGISDEYPVKKSSNDTTHFDSAPGETSEECPLEKSSNDTTQFDESHEEEQQYVCDEENSRKKRKSKKAGLQKNSVYQGPIPEPILPEEVMRLIRDRATENGEAFDINDPERKPILVIQKALEPSDVQNQQNRFSIPMNRMKQKFLNRDEEENLLKLQGKQCNRMMVDIIEPSGTVRVVPLSRWMIGKSSNSYIINGDWKSIRFNNGLEEGNIVQLWAARIGENLCFAFVILDQGIAAER